MNKQELNTQIAELEQSISDQRLSLRRIKTRWDVEAILEAEENLDLDIDMLITYRTFKNNLISNL